MTFLRRLDPAWVLFWCALLCPPLAWLAGSQMSRAEISGQQLASAEPGRSHREAAMKRADEWATEFARLQTLASQSRQLGWNASNYQVRSFLVENRIVSRREADQYLRSTQPSPDNFFVLESFSIRANEAGQSLFDKYSETGGQQSVKVLLRGRQYIRNPAP